MRILFVSDFIQAIEQGAKRLTYAHYSTLCEIFGTENVDIVSLNATDSIDSNLELKKHIVYYEKRRSKFEKLRSIFCGVPFLISRKGENRVVHLCEKNQYSCVFVDHSIYGHLVKKIRVKANIPVVSFFHGIMQYQNIEYKKLNKTSPLYFLPCYNMKKNERDTVKYSSRLLLLNKRDEKNLKKFYNRGTKDFLSVYYNDTAKIEQKADDVFRILFVGGYFWPNVHGITWFVERVMPNLPQDIHLLIVGNGMDKLATSLTRKNVKVVGRVESLDGVYNNADVVVGPIFEGEGMKSKTCEALMYGKMFLGTSEALIGYDELKDNECNSDEDFIKRILQVRAKKHSKYYQEYRDLYLKKYSPQMAKNVLNNLFKEIGVID